MNATPDQIVTIGSFVNREWGSYGYTIEALETLASVTVARVRHSDGSRFFVMTDRYGNTDHLQCNGVETEKFDRPDLIAKVEALHQAAVTA